LWERLDETKKPELNDPVLLVSLSTSLQQYRALYSHARELGRFMLKNMEFEKFATLYSSAMPPLVVISDGGMIRLTSTSFHHYAGKRDIVLLAGDASPVDNQYEYCESVIGYAKKLGIGEIVSIGTRWTEEAGSPTTTPVVKGFASEEKGVKELKSLGVEIIRDEPAPFFASLIVALARRHGISAVKLSVDHGEPMPHPRSVIQLLAVLQKMLGFSVETSDLSSLADKMAANLESAPGPEAQPRRSGVYG
jgi:proteasome assembly chaperone (PAC2) family protein